VPEVAVSRAAVFSALVLFGCGRASELPDLWTHQPRFCPIDEDCETTPKPLVLATDGGAALVPQATDAGGGAP
jgi:hypothetical protein